MTISHKTQFLLVNATLVTAALIQLARGYQWFIVLICGLTFLLVGNLTVFLAGSKQRAAARQRKRDLYTR